MHPRLTTLELQIMEILWEHGPLPIREVQERLSSTKRPAYTTVQTLIYRLEAKKALRRTSKTGNAHIFEPSITRTSTHQRLIDEFIALLGGNIQPVMAHLVDTGKLTLDDVRDAEARLRDLKKRRAGE